METLLLALNLTLVNIDYLQTKEIVRRSYYRENNPVIEPVGVDRYFLIANTAIIAGHFLTPKKDRVQAHKYLAVVQVGAVVNNYAIGVRVQF